MCDTVIFGMRAPRVVSILLFEESRKVAAGLWTWIVAVALYGLSVKLRHKGIPADLLFSADLFSMFWLSGVALIGGGTVADKFIDARKPKPPVTPS